MPTAKRAYYEVLGLAKGAGADKGRVAQRPCILYISDGVMDVG